MHITLLSTLVIAIILLAMTQLNLRSSDELEALTDEIHPTTIRPMTLLVIALAMQVGLTCIIFLLETKIETLMGMN
ncbi:TMhelix containing protein [Vibrio phage 1.081.O._10N.286.52.C2]|nr:TMhelix containing protein [Vibrio phage 1.081.O._10N.286.52.C2]